MDWFPFMIQTIGIADGAMILCLGFVAAAAYLFDWKAEAFYKKILPACGMLIGTSVAAGIVIAITRWIVRAIST